MPTPKYFDVPTFENLALVLIWVCIFHALSLIRWPCRVWPSTGAPILFHSLAKRLKFNPENKLVILSIANLQAAIAFSGFSLSSVSVRFRWFFCIWILLLNSKKSWVSFKRQERHGCLRFEHLIQFLKYCHLRLLECIFSSLHSESALALNLVIPVNFLNLDL